LDYQMTKPDIDRGLRPQQIADFFGVGLSTYWRWVSEKPGFPQPVRMSNRVTTTSLAECIAYRESLKNAVQAFPIPGRKAKPAADKPKA
jgi:predicted DNA-binding transcriptional regulator AlpA